MKDNSTNEIRLTDGWTHDPDYRRCYQTEEDIETILGLLKLAPQLTFVDIGCGNGAFAIAAAQKYPDCQVWAFDALESAIAECKAQAGGTVHNLKAEIAWAHSIPLASSSVDRALFRSVLHHIAEPRAVYSEIARLLKSRGRLILQTPCNYWEAHFGQVLSDIMMLDDDSHCRFYYRPEDILADLGCAGFTTQKPECWPYEFPFIDDRQAQFIRQNGAEERLRLRKIESSKWAIDGYWARVIAERIG